MKLKIATAAQLVLMLASCAPAEAPPPAITPESPAPTPAPVASPVTAPVAPVDGPPVENGLYAARGACPFEGCMLQVWRVEKVVELRGTPSASAAVTATAPVGEWVKATDSISYLVPERGVVLKDVGDLRTGDVVYRLDHLGEGVFTVWRRGEMLEWTDDGERDDTDPFVASGVKWATKINDMFAKAQADKALGAGWWVQVTRSDGTSGWTLVDDNFACTGVIGAEPECAAKQGSAQ